MGPFAVTIRRFLLALAACLCIAAPAPSQDHPYPDDLFLTYQARTALFSDPQLKPLNIGVRVYNGHAVLWGPISTSQQSYRAEHVLKKLNIFKGVINELEVEQPETGGQWSPADGSPYLPTNTPKDTKPSSPSPVNVAKDPAPNPIIPTTGWVPAVAKPSEPESVKPAPVLELHRPIPAATVSTAKPAPINLRKNIDSMLAEHGQFRGLSVDEVEGVVTIRGPQSLTPAMYELARRVARLPNVARVVVQPK